MHTAPLIDLYDRSPLSWQVNTIVNNHSGRTYPVQHNIPVLLHGKYLHGNKTKNTAHSFADQLIDKLFYNSQATNARRSVLKQATIQSGHRVLLVSAGNGTDLRYLSELFDLSAVEITGTDLSMHALQQCRRSMNAAGVNGSLINCCAEALPFEDGYFDVVLYAGATDSFADKNAAAREMMRVAKPGAAVIMIAEESRRLVETRKNHNSGTGYFSNMRGTVAASL